MLDQVLSLFEIVPHYDLDIMQENQSLAQVTSIMLARLEPVILAEKPDWVLVQGDTTSAMVGALSAFYQGEKIGHIEAGLRTWNKSFPFPEEVNRKIIDGISDLHFAPTECAKLNLLREGIPGASIIITGNTGIDALQWVASLPCDMGVLNIPALAQPGVKLLLVTAHRRENNGEPLANICLALQQIAQRFRDRIHIVYPVHLNPNVQGPVYRFLSDIPNISLLPPLDYLHFVHLMKRAYLVLTDSGGIQEEAPCLGKPVLVMRESTERPEGIEAGTMKLVGTDPDRLMSEISCLLNDPEAYQAMARAVNLYGDGHAAERIVESVSSWGPCRTSLA